MTIITKYIKTKTKDITEISIINNYGDSLVLSNFGASILEINTHLKNGETRDITLGYSNFKKHIENLDNENEYYFGTTVGRYANRIAKGTFVIGDKKYHLEKNEGEHHLHGGKNAMHNTVWDFELLEKDNKVVFSKSFIDGENGYPGNLNVKVAFSLNDNREVKINYTATTNKPTPINLTNHTYFNLNGGVRNVLKHSLKLKSNYILETDNQNIPTGKLIPVKDSDFDFRQLKMLNSCEIMEHGGFDNSYVLNSQPNLLNEVALLHDENNTVSLKMFTTEPSLQLYTSGCFDGTLFGKNNVKYTKYFGICLEAQHFPDSPNHNNFPNTILYPKDKYEQTTIYQIIENQAT